MKKDQLPNLFQNYWLLQAQIPPNGSPSNKENLSEDWRNFLKAVNKRVKENLNE